ncbi:hypothetical protein [Sorangium sp. So ce1151]|uniref:hypothetical protein n=1 Tax=Sorangium sp. So ce1151 TaxID=3133332 RepID=UPI003F62131C
MMLILRDDLPSTAGLEDLGPLGSLVPHEGVVVRVPRSGHPFDPRPAVPVDDAAPLRDAARLVAEGLVLTNHPASQLSLMNEWVEGALGPPRATCSIGRAEQLLWFEGAVLLLLESDYTLACATSERLRTLLAHPLAGKPSLEPARYSYGRLESPPRFGALLGSVAHPETYFPEACELHETEGGCSVRGVLQGAFATQFQMGPGAAIATVPRHPDRFVRASSFGEWQPGLRNTDGLRAQLEEHRASEALTRAVLAADDIVGGFRGGRGIQMIAPWAAGAIRKRTASGVWAEPRHPYNGSWFIGWVMIAQVRAGLYVDEMGGVWASWQDPGDDEVQIRLVGESVEHWFERQLYLLEHGYASEATCSSEETLPPGLDLREDLSDETAKVFVDKDAVWLVEENGIQRMSRHVSSVSDVLAVAARFG